MLKHLSLLFLLLYFSFFTLLANDNIPFEQLTFTSELERNFFNSSLNNSTSRIQMLSAINPNINERNIIEITEKLEEIYNHLERKNIRKKEHFKAATLIHHTFHQKLFNDFKKYSYFNEVFTNGDYNCATATAVLALAFEHFEIPYLIQEQRNHVFIIIQTKTNDIIVESTNAKNGVYLIDKKSLIENWRKLNLIQLQQNAFINYDSLFRVCTKTDFYKIGFKELTANLYTNAAISMQKNELHEEAEQMMKKSLYLYSNRNEKFRNMVNINHLVLTIDVHQLETLQPLLQLIKKEHSTLAQEELLGLFETATKYLLLEQNDFDTHKNLCNYIIHHLDASANQQVVERMNYINSYYKKYLTMAN